MTTTSIQLVDHLLRVVSGYRDQSITCAINSRPGPDERQRRIVPPEEADAVALRSLHLAEAYGCVVEVLEDIRKELGGDVYDTIKDAETGDV
jgi:hypothetical protein